MPSAAPPVLTVPPRAATQPDLTRPADGWMGALVGNLHGRSWLPWQLEAGDVIGQLEPDGSYTFKIVVVMLPRQVGKTTFMFDLAIGRCLQYRDYRCAYAAHTGHKTTERFTDRYQDLATGPLSRHVRVRRSAGTERITARTTHSYLKAFPAIPDALRSDALDLVIVDEAQKHGTVLGEQLDLTILPTFTTRPRRQLIVVGTAGTDASDYLRRYLDKARNHTPGYGLIEYGAHDTDDLESEATWQARHPGLGHLTDLPNLRMQREAMGPAGFAREYLTMWSRTTTQIIDPADWTAVQAPDAPRPRGRLCLSVDVAADRGSAAIAIASPHGYVEVTDTRPGTDWAAPRALELAEKHGLPIAVDRFGAVGTVADALERAGADLLTMTAADVANAAAAFLDGIAHHTLQVFPSEALSEAVAGAAQRPLGDSGGFAWSRRASAAPVAPLVAASNAWWGAVHLAPPDQKPVVYAT